MQGIQVHKLDYTSNKVITAYSGKVIRFDPVKQVIVIKAIWERPDLDLGYTTFENGDIFTEYYYGNHWYNVFTIHSRYQKLRGWYCNITKPAVITPMKIDYVDLFLDLWITPQGKIIELDQDEFSNAEIDDATRSQALNGMMQLKEHIATCREPFMLFEKVN